MAKFNVSGEQHFCITGQILEIQRQIRLKSGSPINPEKVDRALQDIIEGKFNSRKKDDDKILNLISANEKIMIEALDGTDYISDAKDIFNSFIDNQFQIFGLSQPGLATIETLVEVREMVGNGAFMKIFTEISFDLDNLVMTQAQIICFCKKHSLWLRQENFATFFLTKNNEEYFVVYVLVNSDGLCAYVDSLEYGEVWKGVCRRRIISPLHIPFVNTV